MVNLTGNDPEEILSLLEICGNEVHWLQVPSHVGIRGNHKADELADVGRRKSPLLFGHISLNMMGRVEVEEDGEEDFDEQSLLGINEGELADVADSGASTTPDHPSAPNRGCTEHSGEAHPTSTHRTERWNAAHGRGGCSPHWTLSLYTVFSIRRQLVRSDSETPQRGLDQFQTPRVVGPACRTSRRHCRGGWKWWE